MFHGCSVFPGVGVFTGGHRVPWRWCSSVDSLVVPPGGLQRATVMSAGAQHWLNEVRVVGMGTDIDFSDQENSQQSNWWRPDAVSCSFVQLEKTSRAVAVALSWQL